MTFKFIWRLEEGGSFYEQDHTGCKSFLEAYENWSDYWGVSETDCIVFKTEKIK